LYVADVVAFLNLAEVEVEFKEGDFFEGLSEGVKHSVSADLIGHFNVGKHLKELIDGEYIFSFQEELEEFGKFSA
jgi:hypothetical protein